MFPFQKRCFLLKRMFPFQNSVPFSRCVSFSKIVSLLQFKKCFPCYNWCFLFLLLLLFPFQKGVSFSNRSFQEIEAIDGAYLHIGISKSFISLTILIQDSANFLSVLCWLRLLPSVSFFRVVEKYQILNLNAISANFLISNYQIL